MIEFSAHKDCIDCPLHETAKSPGLPTREYKVSGKRRALLVVGEAPGANEDREGKIWVGYAGGLLGRFLDAMKFEELVDVYLGNACRCRPPKDDNPTHSQINKCRGFLEADIITLSAYYEEIILFACGAPAAFSIAGQSSLNIAFKRQGMPLTEDGRVKAFFTYHPALLHPARKPAKVRAVEAHFVLVRRYLEGKFIPNALRITPEYNAPLPRRFPARVVVDVETYGILKGQEQTVFMPIKSKVVDGVPEREQAVSAAFAYRDEEGMIRTPIYLFRSGRDQEFIREWFRSLSKKDSLLIGQNLKFDLQYLSVADKELSYWIDPRRLRVDDTLLKSFLLYEQQPEKGLKELATLYGISDYKGIREILGRATGPGDKQLHQYNCLDAAITLVLYEECEARIKERYGDKTYKFTQTCADLCNAIIWDTFELERSGIAFDAHKLIKTDKALQQEHGCLTEDLRKEGIIAGGEGSDKSLRQFILRLITECGLLGDSRVLWTPKTKLMAIKKENVALLLKYLLPGQDKILLEKLRGLQARSTLIDSYTKPLLTDCRKGCVCRLNSRVLLAYPTWYPMPSYYSRGDSGEEKIGGTIQGRFSAQRPSVPTFPDLISGCLTTRFTSGSLIEYDISQAEVRMAALLSGDPAMLYIFANGLNMHFQTTLEVFPMVDIKAPGFKSTKEYKLCNTLTFLILYRGGAEKLQETARNMHGIDLEASFCYGMIRKWYAKYPVFKDWQDDLIDLVEEQGYYELPTGWSRTFTKGIGARLAYINEICNFPIQTLLAQSVQSGQYLILRGIKDRGMATRIVSNNYDSLIFDVPSGEQDVLHTLVDGILRKLPVWGVVEEWVGRSVPVEYGKKIIAKYPENLKI